MSDPKTLAIKLGCEAFAELQKAGMSEQFMSIIGSINQAQKGNFFGSFGSETGVFIEFKNCNSNLMPIQLCFGIRRYKQNFWSKIKYILRESWAVLHGYDTEHKISLQPEEITKLKDLLKVI